MNLKLNCRYLIQDTLAHACNLSHLYLNNFKLFERTACEFVLIDLKGHILPSRTDGFFLFLVAFNVVPPFFPYRISKCLRCYLQHKRYNSSYDREKGERT